MGMKEENWDVFTRPYDLRDRLFEFACVIVRLVQYLQTKDAVADHFLGKRRISLRELKEALFRLRVLRSTGYLGPEHDPVIQETLELKRIMASLVRKTAPRAKRRPSSDPKL